MRKRNLILPGKFFLVMPRRGGRSRVKSTAHRSQPIVDLTEPNEHLADHFQSLSVTPPDSVKRRRTNKPVSTGQVSPPQVMVSPSPVMTLPPPVMPPTMGLPGREAEFEIIRDKLLDAIKCQQGCCICKETSPLFIKLLLLF